MRKPQRRTVYDNYNLWEDYDEDVREIMEERGNNNPSENDIWDEINFMDEVNWELEKENLENFFSEGIWIIRGTVGRWNGTYPAGTVFTGFMEMFSKAAKDCDYVHIYDENGHLYLKCSHHDGTNLYEIKKLTDKGIEYLENWEQNWNDKRSERYIHEQIMKRYSMLPHFVHNVYGCPKVEYEKETV